MRARVAPRFSRPVSLAAGVLAVLLGCSWTSVTRADVRIAPSAEGHLGAWLVLGPIAASQVGRLDTAALDARLGTREASIGLAWRLASFADGALDVQKLLGSPRVKGSGPYAVVAGSLELDRDLDGWLLVGVDGGATVFVDGRTVASQDAAKLRDRAWDVLPLRLAKGTHRISFRLHQRLEHWAFAARILDRSDFRAPSGFALRLRGASARDAERLLQDLQSLTFATGLHSAAYRPRVAIEYRRGRPLDIDTTVFARATHERSGRVLFDVRASRLPTPDRGTQPFDISLPEVTPAALEADRAEPLRIQVRVGASANGRTLYLNSAAPGLLARAETSLGARRKVPNVWNDVVSSTLEHRVERLARVGAGPRANQRSVQLAADRVKAWLDALDAGKNPLAASGMLHLARRSELDGQPQRFMLYVPKSYDPAGSRQYPLVVLLHGFDGKPNGVLAAFFDTPAESPFRPVDGFVLAPHAHGNAFYRGPGEHEVMREIEWVKRTYPIDSDRVTLSGVSMGGTGTAQLALRYADTFAAASPLCGYHSYFVRRDTQGLPLASWERDQMAHWSPASFAENGRNLPLLVAHGTRDFPLENSKALIGRYRTLGYRVSEDWPETGHDVWKVYWAGARMWPTLTSFKRNAEPTRITFKTDSPRYASHHWLTVRAMEANEARVDAELTGPRSVNVAATGVLDFELTPPESRVASAQERTLTINGESLRIGPGARMAAHREGPRWLPGPGISNPRAKRARVSGPIHDVWNEPLVFVYGTGSAATMRANRELCETLARLRNRVSIRYAVLPDSAVTPELERASSLFLVGNKFDHSLVRAVDASLPIGAVEDGVRANGRVFRDSEVGALFIHPNPRAPDRYLVLLESNTLAGAFRALSLPQLLPDFVIYDARVAPAAGQQVLGGTPVIAAGYFDADWSLSEVLLGASGAAQPAAARP